MVTAGHVVENEVAATPSVSVEQTADTREQHPAGDLSARQQAQTARSLRTTELLREAMAQTDAKRRQEIHDRIVVDHLGVARSLAARYRGKGIESDDLVQVANLGLVKAVAGCDPDRCEEFLQYAVPTIVGELKRHFRDRGWAVRPTRRIQELHAAVGTARSDLIQTLGREPSEDEVALRVGTDTASVREASSAGQYLRIASLDALTASGVGREDVGGRTEDGPDRIENSLIIRPAVAALSERERRLVVLRFVEGRTQAEIGKDLGLSQMHISRLLRDVLKKLRETLEPAALAG